MITRFWSVLREKGIFKEKSRFIMEAIIEMALKYFYCNEVFFYLNLRRQTILVFLGEVQSLVR